MPTDNLKNAVMAALDSFGRVRTLKIAPALASLEGWTNESLAGIMMDANDIICDGKHQENLMFLKEFFCSTEAAQNEMKTQFDEVTRSLAAGLRFQTASVGIKYRSGNTPKSIVVVIEKESPEYLPLLGVVFGNEKGPLKSAIESIFGFQHWCTSLPCLTEQFVTSVLRLWREVLQTWIEVTLEREESPEFEIVRTATAAQVAQAKVQRGTVPIEPARPAQTQGIKRSRSLEEEDSAPRLRKRKTIPTPPSTPAVEGRENGQTLAPGRSQFVEALIKAIPSYTSPVSQQGVDVTYTFRRADFSQHFGSGTQGLEVNWPRKEEGHKYHRYRPPGAGSEHLIGGQIKYNPYFPQTPCGHGLIFRAPGFKYKFGNGGDAEPYTNTVLFQVAQSKWLYLGEYVVKYQGSLPCDEWNSSTPKFKNDWVKHLTEAPKHYDGPQVPQQQMRQSLDDGTLKLEVYQMRCVDYHAALQARIIKLGL